MATCPALLQDRWPLFEWLRSAEATAAGNLSELRQNDLSWMLGPIAVFADVTEDGDVGDELWAAHRPECVQPDDEPAVGWSLSGPNCGAVAANGRKLQIVQIGMSDPRGPGVRLPLESSDRSAVR